MAKFVVLTTLAISLAIGVQALLGGASPNSTDSIFFVFYNGTTVDEYVIVPLKNATDLLDEPNFDKNRSTVLYKHGYKESYQSESVKTVVKAYLQKNSSNIVVVDWSTLAGGIPVVSYPIAAANTKPTGEAVAEAVNRLINGGLPLENLHLIGHSLGSHVAGCIARTLKNNFARKIHRLTALDAAFPGFYPPLLLQPVGPSDAKFVDTIHTDGGRYGTPNNTGTADFYPNKGIGPQPGCPLIFLPIILSADDLCSHWRSWRYYAESVKRWNAFPASNKANPQDVQYMGYGCDPSASGAFCLTTNAAPPYGKGIDGIC